jgi:hypothetical protein
MSLQDDPEDRVSVIQLNSELRHAQLELLSAHCAIHQLRLRYSADDVIRFGRREVLHNSAQAARALNDFYAGIEGRIVESAPSAKVLQEPSRQQIRQAVEWIASCLRSRRENYRPMGQLLDGAQASRLGPYFSAELLDRVRIVELEGARVEVPDFLAQVRAMGYDNLPDLPHLDSVTFLDVVVFNETLTERALFHGLVHAVQIDVLGLERYSELWVSGFLRTKAHFTVPLEVQAFALSSKFLRTVPEKFSVEEQVQRWVEEGRY